MPWADWQLGCRWIHSLHPTPIHQPIIWESYSIHRGQVEMFLLNVSSVSSQRSRRLPSGYSFTLYNSYKKNPASRILGSNRLLSKELHCLVCLLAGNQKLCRVFPLERLGLWSLEGAKCPSKRSLEGRRVCLILAFYISWIGITIWSYLILIH